MKRFLNFLLGLFKSGTQKPEVSAKPYIVAEAPKKEEPKPTFPSPIKKRKIAIARGHGGKDGGAEGQSTNEVEYNTFVMQEIAKAGLNVTCHYGDNSAGAMLKAITSMPDLIIQMHLNSADSDAQGCEVLVIEGDVKSYPFAEEFAANFNAKFNKPIRRASTKGKKILGSSDRGAKSLKLSKLCPKILVEPFFISSKNDFVPKEEYARFMIEQLKKWGA